KFYSLKSYRFTTKIFSLIVRNASSFLDFYSLFFIPLVLLFYFFALKQTIESACYPKIQAFLS
ncbi:hypothetical protein, partial [Helicobacter pylori]|uniref:hypothetical protein n=1 Tax=Helicobacter pylori TaxID=210 RepID=UPI000EB3779A